MQWRIARSAVTVFMTITVSRILQRSGLTVTMGKGMRNARGMQNMKITRSRVGWIVTGRGMHDGRQRMQYGRRGKGKLGHHRKRGIGLSVQR